MKETPIDTDLEEMRRRFNKDGYIFVKNVMPREDVLNMREAYFAHLQPTGILKPGTSPRDGIFDDREDPVAHNGVGGSDLPEAIERVNKLEEAHHLPFYLAFLEHPKLRTFVQEFMGWKKDVLITRTMLRYDCEDRASFQLLILADTTFQMACLQVFTTIRSSCVPAKQNFSQLGCPSVTAHLWEAA
jgi:phytanoyl-CoA hydroxylase